MKCLLVEDQVLFAELLCGMLRSSSIINSVSIAPSVSQALQLINRSPPDILVLDLNLPDGDGQEVALNLVNYHPNPAIIILSAQANDFDCDPRLQPYLHAIIEKTSAYKELAKAIASLDINPQEGNCTGGTEKRVQMMTSREQEVYLLIGKGKSSREICSILNISLSTVESHRKAIAQCLGTSGADLVRRAAIHCFKAEEGLLVDPAE